MMIPHSKPSISKRDIDAVLKVLKCSNIASGRYVLKFEKILSKFLGLSSGVTTSSGTSALHLALLALNLREDDEVIIPAYTCASLLNAVYYIGARPVLVDIDDSFNISVEDLKKRITKKTKAIIVPHMFGQSADIDKIIKFGIPVIEDLSHSLGANFKGKRLGSFGELCVVSFYATKLITSGEGGIVLGKSKRVIDGIRDLREYDKKEDFKIRYNYKMTDFQAALALAQFKSLALFIKKRKELAMFYNEELKNIKSIILPFCKKDRGHIFYRYVIKIRDLKIDSVIESLNRCGIDCKKPIFKPLHHYLKEDGFPKTEEVFNSSLSIPIYPVLTFKDAKKIVKILRSTF